MQILHGNNIDLLKTLPENSVDSVVTDPPYGLSFMNKKWDYVVPSVDLWQEVYRVLKHGGHLLSFGGTRTYHRMVVNMEDAGFEIRDQIMWLYGCGFPKSHNIGKAIEKMVGNQDDKQWKGWGSSLKPANEPICLARKPLSEKSIAENVLKYGTGGINIDGCRVGEFGSGRFPANVIHDGSDEVLKEFPDNKGAFAPVKSGQKGFGGEIYGKYNQSGDDGKTFYNDGLGSASRFFYCAKASKSDREDGNNHPTVKPTELMRYLCRLITPPNGIVLDPFSGSGSTGKGAVLEGFDYIGIEFEYESVEISKMRIANAQKEYEQNKA